MDIQQQFYDSIQENDIENFKILLNNKKINPSDADNWAIQIASIYGYFDIVKLLINDKRVNPSCNGNFPIEVASNGGYLDIIKLLLNDKRVDPSDSSNRAICSAYSKGYLNIVNLLWQDQRVQNTLKKDNFNLYNKLIKKDKIKNKVEKF